MSGGRYDLKELRDASAAWEAANFGQVGFDLQRQPHLTIKSARVSKVEAAVSPDCAYFLVADAIAAAQQEICLYIYNASAPHMLDLLRAAKDRGVHIRIMYDVNDTRGEEQQKLADLGVDLKEAPSSNGRKVFTVCHQKFAVIDDEILMLGSANWATTSIPKLATPPHFKKGNREWLVRIDAPALARWFKHLFQLDWDIPVVPNPEALIAAPEPLPPVFAPAALANVPAKVFGVKKWNFGTPVFVKPVVSPNNYFAVTKKLIAEATTSVDIEQQYIISGGPKTEALLALLQQRRNELTIRIIVSPMFRKVGGVDSWEQSVASLAAFGLDDCLRGMNLQYYTHLHNKGVIVDRSKVIVSSTNWSENSITRAREAGVLIDSPQVASYFADVFDFDWSVALDAVDLPANLRQLEDNAMNVPGGGEEVHPADLV